MSEKNQSLYYNKRSMNNNIAIFKFDMISENEFQVTDNITMSDFMSYDQSADRLFARVVQNNHRNFQLLSLDCAKNKYTVWNTENYDESIRAFSYDNVSKNLLLATYSAKEQNDKINKANKVHNPSINLNMQLSLYNSDGKKIKTIYKTDKQIESISIDHNCKSVLVNFGTNGIISSHRTVQLLDVNSGKLTEILPESKIYNNFSYAQFSTDNNGIYFLANKNNSDCISDNTGRVFYKKYLIYYNLKTKNYSEIFEKSDGIINYFSVIS